jgi:hypothetical protein
LLFGQTKHRVPSRFLSEIPEKYVIREDLGGGAVTGGFSSAKQCRFPSGTRVYSDEYGPGFVEKADIKEGHEVVVARFDTGRVVKILPQYHDLVRIQDD